MRRLLLLPLAVLVLALPAAAARLPIVAAADWWPVVSPTGAVAFTRVQGRVMRLEVVSHGRLAAIAAATSQLSPSWSPSGSQLAYASDGAIYVAAPDGSGRHRYPAPAKAFAPAWRPGSTQLAYLTTHGAANTDLWVGDALWARGAIGRPAWSPDGARIAFQRDDGIWTAAGPGDATRVAAASNPGSPAWSPNGEQIAYTAGGALYVAPSAGLGPIRRLATGLANPGPPAWGPDGTVVSVSHTGGVLVAQLGGPGYALDRTARTFGAGSAWLGPNALVSASLPGCPGHDGIVEVAPSGRTTRLSGSCTIAGTPGADTIDGTSLWGDVIAAGAGDDRIHANDGHTDRVNCGPGRDTVWADRSDRLTGCEVVHR